MHFFSDFKKTLGVFEYFFISIFFIMILYQIYLGIELLKVRDEICFIRNIISSDLALVSDIGGFDEEREIKNDFLKEVESVENEIISDSENGIILFDK